MNAPTTDWQRIPESRLNEYLDAGKSSASIATALNAEYGTNLNKSIVQRKRKSLADRGRTANGSRRRPLQETAWDPCTARFIQLYGEGDSHSTIAAKINQEYGTQFTKNSCVAKRRRLHLPDRESKAAPTMTWSDEMHTRLLHLLVIDRKSRRQAAVILTNELGRPITIDMIDHHFRRLRRPPSAPKPSKPCTLASQWSAPPEPIPLPRMDTPVVLPKPVDVSRQPMPLQAKVVVFPAMGRVAPCCWPLNDGHPWQFCEEPSEPGRVYCTRHCGAAYIKIRDYRGGTGEAA